jgi:hypothetical protein
MGKSVTAIAPPAPVITDQEKTSMATKHPKLLSLTGKICRMGKYSNNTEFAGGDDWETAWTLPITGVMLTKDELNELLLDKHAHASWYNTGGKGGLIEPMPWWGEEEFSRSGKLEAEELAIIVSGNRELEFVADEPDPDDEDDVGRAACVLSNMVLRPQPGGLTELRFSLTLRPGSPANRRLLEEHQHREVKITLTDAAPAQKAQSKQAQLPLADQGGGDASATH